MKLPKPSNLSFAELTDKGICPTCYNRANNFCLTGDETETTLFENELFKCLLIREPRAAGHTVIVSHEHYKDMMDTPDELIREMYVFAKKAMCALKQVYGSESVYLCTMCDGPMNHFHIQLIPRYSTEKRGSMNFVKERKEYTADPQKLEALRQLMK